ncbi:hypothetical protein LTS17_004069 [Exophiala oligosperma]
MEAVGAATAILTIAIEFQHICKKLNRFIKNVKHAHNDVEVIAHEAETFFLLLQRFGKTMRTADSPEGGFLMDMGSNHISEKIVQASQVIGKKIRNLLKKSEPLRLDKPEYSQIKRWLTLLKWSSWKEEWSQIHLFLVSTKLDAELLISIIGLEALINHKKALEISHREVPEDLQQELEVSRKAIKALRRSVKKLKNKFQRLELRTEDRTAVQVNILLAETTQHIVESYVNTHEEIKAVLTTDTPPTSPQVSNMESGGTVGPSEEGNPTQSRNSIVENSLIVENGSPGGSETPSIIDDDDDGELIDIVWEGGDSVEEVIERSFRSQDSEVVVEEMAREVREESDGGASTSHDSRQSIDDGVVEEGPSVREEHTSRASQRSMDEKFIEEGPSVPGEIETAEANPALSKTESALSFMDFTYSEEPPKKKPSEQWMQSAQYGLHGGKVRRRRQRPKTLDMSPQDIVVDRNDGLGARHEYRLPRRPRDWSTSKN